MTSSRRIARVLGDVRQDIDSFLDPTNVDLPLLLGNDTSFVGRQLTLGSRDSLEALESKLASRLHSELENARREVEGQRSENQRRAERDAVEIADLRRERDNLVNSLPTLIAQVAQDEGQPAGLDAMLTASGAARASSSAMPPSSFDVTLALERSQKEANGLRQQVAQLTHRMEQADVQRRQSQTQLDELRSELAKVAGLADERRLDLRRVEAEKTTAIARTAVLCQAVTRNSSFQAIGDAPLSALKDAVVEGDSELRMNLDAESQRVADLEGLLQVKEQALLHARQEAASLRCENECYTRQLDYDPAKTIVLSLRRKAPRHRGAGKENTAEGASGGNASLDAGEADNTAWRQEVLARRGSNDDLPDAAPGSTCTSALNIEHEQQKRAAERFKQATTKYIESFREGIYQLFGWNVELFRKGREMTFRCTSKFGKGQELVFARLPGAPGHPGTLQLLASAWAEQLQTSSPDSMAFLQVYRSIPGFMGHITCEFVEKQTMAG